MNREASASVMISMAVAAPAGSPIPSMRSSRFNPNMSIDIWHGMNSTPRAWQASSSWRGDLVLPAERAHHPRAHPQEVHLAELQMVDARALHEREHLLHPAVTGDP